MHYISTRDKAVSLTAAQAIVRGLSEDGGLLLPNEFPRLTDAQLAELTSMDYEERAATILKLFLPEFSDAELRQFSAHAYGGGKFSGGHPAPLHRLDEKTYCLELWHGPTCAFKDMALQMLPQLLSASLDKCGERKTACILTATSGDTGKAALEGFRDVAQTCILVFYPRHGVSEIQQLQMTTQEGENVAVCAVEGNFDDAQSGVKRIFSNPLLRETLAERGYFLTSANSINWGRVLPQIVYYISAYCDLCRAGQLRRGESVNFCVPTGNFGNILAAYYAKKLGIPVGKLICASNANDVLTEFLNTGVYDKNRPFYHTTSPSMDILVSSNLERLLFELSGGDDVRVRAWMTQLAKDGRYTVGEELREALGQSFAAGTCGDADAAAMLASMWEQHRYLIDPHTAVAFDVLEQYRARSGDDTPTVVVSTASPFKFCGSVLKVLSSTEVASGTQALEQLARQTGTAIPAPLAGLCQKDVRHHTCISKEEMEDQVMEMLN